MQKTSTDNLILFGYKSCGKTYFGKLLAEKTGLPFIDTDELIEQLFFQRFQEHGNCRAISLKLGEEGFRVLEREVIGSLPDMPKSIIALGGGAVLDSGNCMKLKQIGRLVYLETAKEVIKERIFRTGIPSYLDTHDLDGSFEKMYQSRQLIYANVSPYKVSLSAKTDIQVLDELANFIKPID